MGQLLTPSDQRGGCWSRRGAVPEMSWGHHPLYDKQGNWADCVALPLLWEPGAQGCDPEPGTGDGASVACPYVNFWLLQQLPEVHVASTALGVPGGSSPTSCSPLPGKRRWKTARDEAHRDLPLRLPSASIGLCMACTTQRGLPQGDCSPINGGLRLSLVTGIRGMSHWKNPSRHYF